MRDQLSERYFAALHAPFEPFIPIAALGRHAPFDTRLSITRGLNHDAGRGSTILPEFR